jgi:hypothetical protein
MIASVSVSATPLPSLRMFGASWAGLPLTVHQAIGTWRMSVPGTTADADPAVEAQTPSATTRAVREMDM